MFLSNENGDIISATDTGKPGDWPGEIITTVTFSLIGKQTKMTLHQTVAEAEAKKMVLPELVQYVQQTSKGII